MMKKKLLVCLTMLCMLFSVVPAFAAEQRVFDYANLIDETDEEEMNLWVEDMQENWGMDLACLTTNDTEGKSVQQYGADFYVEQNLGLGENFDGVIFVLDMGSREGQIITCGKAIDIYTDYYIDKMWDNMVGSLSEGDYYWAFFTLYCDLDHYAEEYQEYLTNPDYISPYASAHMNKGAKLAVLLAGSAVMSLVIAFTGSRMAKSRNNNVRPYTDGRAYLKEGGCHFKKNRDTFASTHTSIVPIPRDDNHHHGGGGSWGGPSSTFSGGGRSFGGGGGKF